MRTKMLPVLLGLVVLGAAACGDADGSADAIAGDRIAADTPAEEAPGDTPVSEEVPPAMGMCAEDQPDCDDMAIRPADGEVPPSEQPSSAPADDAGDEFPSEQAREEARALLGMDEADLSDEVRVSRRGEEQYMLTEDYVLGRFTVELDDTDGSGFRVVSVTVELPDGPETFHLTAS